MCDYSLQGLPNRLAVEGEQLVTHRFRTGSVGLASPEDIANQYCLRTARGSWWSRFNRWLLQPADASGPQAVCIPPGARLLMSRIPDRMRRDFSLNAVEPVKFIQLSAEAFSYRDGIELSNGLRVGLQAFREGVAFEVLNLGEGEIVERPAETANIRRSEDRHATGWPIEHR